MMSKTVIVMAAAAAVGIAGQQTGLEPLVSAITGAAIVAAHGGVALATRRDDRPLIETAACAGDCMLRAAAFGLGLLALLGAMDR